LLGLTTEDGRCGVAVRVRVSSKNRIAVPATVREALGIVSGDSLLLEVRGGHVVLVPEPPDYAQRLGGLHREVWEGVEPREYVRREREAWQG
jgi:AbrB family looped-hinge helix DNA binding protein